MDYSNEVPLNDFVLDREKLGEADALKITTQLLDVVKYLNSQHICHRDLKPDNILINPETLEIKLLNFEFSTVYEDFVSMKTKLGNQFYMAPEVINREYTQKCDIWSIGCITYFLQTGFPPFLADSAKEIRDDVDNYNLNFLDEDWENKSPESLAFIRKALTIDPKHRLSIDSALDHPWINNDSEKIVSPNPQDLATLMDSDSFDMFLREILSMMIENFDIPTLQNMLETLQGDKNEVMRKIISSELLILIENNATYEPKIKELLRNGLKLLDTEVDLIEFMNSVIDEKNYIEHAQLDEHMIVEILEHTAVNFNVMNAPSEPPSIR